MAITKLVADSLGTGVGGKVLQVVSATDSTQRSTTSTSFVTASNTLSVSITPASTLNKILLFANSSVSIQGTYNAQWTIYRDSTNLGHATYGFNTSNDSTNYTVVPMAISYLDSPSSTSALTYQVYFKSSINSQSAFLNYSGVTGTITAIEVSA